MTPTLTSGALFIGHGALYISPKILPSGPGALFTDPLGPLNYKTYMHEDAHVYVANGPHTCLMAYLNWCITEKSCWLIFSLFLVPEDVISSLHSASTLLIWLPSASAWLLDLAWLILYCFAQLLLALACFLDLVCLLNLSHAAWLLGTSACPPVSSATRCSATKLSLCPEVCGFQFYPHVV